MATADRERLDLSVKGMTCAKATPAFQQLARQRTFEGCEMRTRGSGWR